MDGPPQSKALVAILETMSNPFKDWTPEMVKEHNERVKTGVKAVKDSFDALQKSFPATARPKMEIKPPKKKPLLNKTETLFKAELERRGHKVILCQAITLRLGDRMTYRPDFVTVETIGRHNSWDDPLSDAFQITAWETKGPHRFRQAGINKLKAAAAMYPWICFKLVERSGSNWSERTIGI